MADVRIVIHDKVIDVIANDATTLVALADIAQQIAEDAKHEAPQRTGRGAGSIHHEPFKVRGRPEERVSWEKTFFYMYFQEAGTRAIHARRFLRNAAKAQRRTRMGG